MAKVYDRFMAASEQACLAEWRAELLSHAEGRVLEVGAGTGAAFAHYPDDVDAVVATEPDPHMRNALARKGKLPSRVQVVPDQVGQLSMAPESFDTAVSMLVLCSVQSQPLALSDLHRVLRPGGRLIFLEHVAAQDNPARLAWQRRIEPLWKRIAGGCHLTRRTLSEIEAAGFEVESVRHESMRKALPWVRPTVRGIAQRR